MPQPLILQRESNDGFLLVGGVLDASGKDVDLSTYKGKLLLILNVASQWYENHLQNLVSY
jgi:glutathione peroxidase-family protein